MKRFLAFFAALVAVFFSACGSNDKNTLRLATSAGFPPYEYMGDDGKITGIDIDIANQIADKLGLTLKVTNMEFGAIIPAVVSNKFDIGIAGFTITDERKESVAFSDTYTKSTQVIVVKEDSPIKSVNDLYGYKANYKVGAQLSTTSAIYFGDDITAQKTAATLQEFKESSDAIAALQSGKIDCVIVDIEPAKKFVEVNKGLKILETEYIVESYAMVLNKNNTELLNKINQALKELRENGTIDRIVTQYIK